MDGTVRKWLGLSRFQSWRRLDPRIKGGGNVDVRGRVRSRGNTRVSRVCIMQWRWSGALDASPSTRRGRKGEEEGEGWAMGAKRKRRRRWNVVQGTLCLNRHATLVFFPSPFPPVPCLPSSPRGTTAAVSLLPSLCSDFPRSRFSLFRSYPPFFPPFFFVSFHNGGLHRRPLTPRPGVQEDWSAIHFRVARDSTRQKSTTPSPSFSPFFLPSLLLSIYPALLLFRRPSNSCPGEATKPGEKWGNGERRVARSLVFLILEMVMEDRKKGVEFGIECSFLFFFFFFFLSNRNDFRL